MIYNGTNAPGSLVMDVDAKQRIDRVLVVISASPDLVDLFKG